MSRETYTLSDETRDAFEGHRGEIALHWGKDRSHVDGIMSGRVPDGFAYFKPQYLAVLNSCGIEGVRSYRDWFAKVEALVGPVASPCDADSVTTLLLEKIRHDAECIAILFAAIADGRIDRKERVEIKAALDKARRHLDQAEKLLNEMPDGSEELRVAS
ncbi:MAG: hypothetical protein JO053_16045 [Acidobacteria bacterium]|nr:hypothetical protein [Acidobacteriota bacterium]